MSSLILAACWIAEQTKNRASIAFRLDFDAKLWLIKGGNGVCLPVLG